MTRYKQAPNESHVQPIALRLVTIKQAPAYCASAIWAIRSRELRACKIGRRYVIDRSDLDALIDARIRERNS